MINACKRKEKRGTWLHPQHQIGCHDNPNCERKQPWCELFEEPLLWSFEVCTPCEWGWWR